MADEPAIGGGPRLPRGRNGNNNGTPVAKATAQVKVDGLNILDRVMSSIAKSTTTIAKNLKMINGEGRTGGALSGFLAGLTGGRAGAGSNTMSWQGSVPALKPSGPTSQTGAPSTLPWTGKLPTITPGGPVSQMGRQGPPGGTPPGGGGGGISGAFRNSMPWLGAQVMRAGSAATFATMAAPGAMLAAAPAVNMLSGRIGQQIAEGAPIAGQSLLTSSMYSGTRYYSIERDRFRQLGQFAGSRQDVAAAGQMALRLGQTPQQAGQYLQGVGNTVQSMGGTMTAPQVIQATGGFLDSLVMRRQIATGMRPARIGGQVRDPREVSADYIKNFEQKFNGGRKLNEFDFINLQTPGSGLRIRFQRLYGLDDSAIDMLTIAGMQSLRVGGASLASSAQLSAAGMSADRISLATASLQTTKGVRNANFMANTEGGMVSQLQTEETIQRALGGLEEATSGLISEFASLERVVKGVVTGLGVIAGLGLLKGGMGGGGGGLLGGLGGGVGFGGFGRTAAGTAGTGAPAAGAAAAGALPAAAGGGGGAMAGIASRAGLAPIGVGFGIAAAKTAANATNWGDMFTATGEGVAAGAAFGTMIGGPGFGTAIGAVGGGVLAFGSAGLNWLTDTSGRDRETARQSTSASNMTDKEILDKFTSNRNAISTTSDAQTTIDRMNAAMEGQIDPATGKPYVPLVADTATFLQKDWKEVHADSADEESTGFLDRFQVRRSALIQQWMNDAVNSGQPFENYMRWLTARWNGRDPKKPVSDAEMNKTLDEWIRIQDKFAAFAGGSAVDDSDYVDAGSTLLDLTQPMRSPGNASHAPGWQELHDIYTQYFRNDVRHPMEYKPVYSDPALSIIEQYQFTPTQYVQSRLAGAAPGEGDPVFGDGNDHGGLTPTEPFNYGSISRLRMAPEPDDPNWNKMDKRMQQRLRIMFANSGGQVKWAKGGGWRSTDRQREMFLDRYRPDPNGEITWNGQKWKHVKGAAAAPPGRSYHEIGLAADLDGPGVGNGWLRKNARRFGLKEFSSVNSEPWHVQLIELPNGRSSYDQGADTGGPGAEPTTATDTAPADVGPSMGGGGNLGIGGGTSGSLLSFGNSSLATLAAGAGSAAGGGGGAAFGGTGGATTADTTVDYSGSGPLTGEQIAKMAYNAGFRGDNLVTILGIAKRESNWDPGAHNTNRNTGDNSYGLTQINMLGDLGPSRARQFGISDYNELLNPQTNLKAAFTMSGGTEFGPWLSYRPGLSISRSQREAAVAAVHAAHLGDAVFDSGQSSSSAIVPRSSQPVSVFGSMVAGSGGRAINVNVTIKSTGNYAYDARQLARQVRPAFEAEYAEVSAKRNT